MHTMCVHAAVVCAPATAHCVSSCSSQSCNGVPLMRQFCQVHCTGCNSASVTCMAKATLCFLLAVMYIFQLYQNYTSGYVPDLIPCMVDTASLKGNFINQKRRDGIQAPTENLWFESEGHCKPDSTQAGNVCLTLLMFNIGQCQCTSIQASRCFDIPCTNTICGLHLWSAFVVCIWQLSCCSDWPECTICRKLLLYVSLPPLF